MKKTVTALILLIGLVIGITIFIRSINQEPQELVIGLSQEGLDHPMMQTQKDEIMSLAEAHPHLTILCSEGKGAADLQARGIEELMAQGIDLLMLEVGAVSRSLLDVLDRVHEAEIPIVMIAKGRDDIRADCIISIDDRAVGREIGRYAASRLAESGREPGRETGGNILVLEGIEGDWTSRERIGGFLEEIGGHKGLVLLDRKSAGYRQPRAYRIVLDWLADYGPGEIDLIMAANADMALGAVQAVREAGRGGEILITGLDGVEGEMKAIREGSMAATWSLRPVGKEGLETALRLLNGESVPDRIIVPSRRVDAGNVDDYLPAMY